MRRFLPKNRRKRRRFFAPKLRKPQKKRGASLSWHASVPKKNKPSIAVPFVHPSMVGIPPTSRDTYHTSDASYIGDVSSCTGRLICRMPDNNTSDASYIRFLIITHRIPRHQTSRVPRNISYQNQLSGEGVCKNMTILNWERILSQGKTSGCKIVPCSSACVAPP